MKSQRNKTIFISYNPKNKVEQAVAIRLHTIGATHGFMMLLPDRLETSATGKISNITKGHISECGYYFLFSNQKPSKVIEEEIAYAKTVLGIDRIIVVFKNRKSYSIQNNLYLSEYFYLDDYDLGIISSNNTFSRTMNGKLARALFLIGNCMLILGLNAKTK